MSSGYRARKRKHWKADRPTSVDASNFYDLSTSSHEAQVGNEFAQLRNSSLYVRAEEADVLIDTEDIAESLDASSKCYEGGHKPQRSALVQAHWGTSDEPVWVDRYDVRLLLTSITATSDNSKTSDERGDRRASSPAGWSDLPSDEEDTFFLSALEVEDVYRAKRRRKLDDDRQQRLQMLRDAEPTDSHEDVETESLWGGSDEECSQSQLELMRRTAAHLSNSENSAQLEMRILANHGGDKRFAFLRGRWRRSWSQEKKAALGEKKDLHRVAAESSSGLVGLASYSDSDEEDEETNRLSKTNENQGSRPQ